MDHVPYIRADEVYNLPSFRERERRKEDDGPRARQHSREMSPSSGVGAPVVEMPSPRTHLNQPGGRVPRPEFLNNTPSHDDRHIERSARGPTQPAGPTQPVRPMQPAGLPNLRGRPMAPIYTYDPADPGVIRYRGHEDARNRDHGGIRDRVYEDIRDHVYETTSARPPVREYTRNDLYELHNLEHNLKARAEHGRGLFQTIYDVANPKNVTVHLDFPVFQDYDAEIEDFSRLRRLGNFEAANDLFKRTFEGHLKNPYIFVQYAEMLLDMGDYKSFDLLDPKPAFGGPLAPRPGASRERQGDGSSYLYDRPRVARKHRSRVPRRSRSWEWQFNRFGDAEPAMHGAARESDPRPPPPFGQEMQTPATGGLPVPPSAKRPELWSDETQLLAINWRLLKALSLIHHNGTINEALEEARFTLETLVVNPDAGSTEVQIMSLALRIFGHIRVSFPDIYRHEFKGVLEHWADWPKLYKNLLTQGRIWDFRDVFLASISAFDLKQTRLNFFGPEPSRDKILDNWTVHMQDDSTILAQLDILVFMILDLEPPESDMHGTEVAVLKEDAQSLAELIMKNHPESMKTRPFMRWLLAKATESIFKEEENSSNTSGTASRNQFKYLRNYPGIYFFPPGWISLPVYVPREFEIPSWQAPEQPLKAHDPVRMALAVATQLQDYTTQALCLKLLILTSQDATKLFDQLGQLQKSVQEDRGEYLLTCVSSYLICRDKASQSRLLAELRDMGDWTDPWILYDPQAYLAKQYIERALSANVNDRRILTPLKKSSMLYCSFLSKHTLDFVKADPEVNLHDSLPHRHARTRDADAEEHDRPDSEVDLPDFLPRRHARARDADAEEHSRIAVEPRKHHKHTSRSKSTKRPEREVGDEDQDYRSSLDSWSVLASQGGSKSGSSSQGSSSGSYSSDNGINGVSDDFRQLFSHGNRRHMRKRLLAGKRITVAVDSPQTREEYDSISWIKQGDYIITTKVEKILDKKVGTSKSTRRRRTSKKEKRKKDVGSDSVATDSVNSDAESRADDHNQEESSARRREDSQLALIRHPDPNNEGIRIIE